MNKIKSIFSKIKNFIVNNRKNLLHALYIVLGVVAVSVVSLIILMLTNVIYFDDGIQFNTELFMAFKDKWYGWIAFVILQTILSMLLCVIPGAAMALTILSMTIYTNPLHAFIISFIAAFIASHTLYAIGRFGGYKLCVKYLGGSDCEKALTLLRNRGTVYFPLLMAFPAFPDEALTMVAGVIKMSLKWFVPSIVIARGIGIVAITFGLSSIPFEKFTSIFHWIIFIVGVAALVAGLLYAAHRLNVHMEKKRNEHAAKAATENEAE